MVRFTHGATPLVVGLLVLSGCPGDDAPIDTDGASSSSSGEGPGPGPGPGPGTDPDSSTGDPGTSTTLDPDSTTGEPPPECVPACDPGQCCVGGSACFDAPEPSCNPGCGPTEVCDCPEGEDPCSCVAECQTCGVEETSFENCLEAECPAGSVCVVDDPMDPTFGVCAVQGCGEDACACPLPPGTGEALNNCGDFTGDDGGGSCYLDCSNGESCPDDMVCRQLDGLGICVWPGEGIESDCCFANGTPGCDDATCENDVCAADAFCCSTEWDQICADAAAAICPVLCPGATLVPQYGDCINVGVCEAGLQCLSNGTFGWCSTVGCMDVMDCEPAPPTGDAPPVCATFDDGMGGMFNACILDCAMNTCPDGMDCFNNSFCVWNPIIPGFGNCGLSDQICNMGETCVDDGDPMMMIDPTWAVCSEGGCADASECAFEAPPGGDAMIACGDPSGMGGPNTCYLDCAGGMVTCPDGMACINDSHCAWPLGTSIFSDDFETGDFSMGWTLNNVDMNMPNMNVAFVNDAWVASNAVDGPNFSAVSTSWYEPVGQSDDWLISPQLMLGPNTRVYWQAVTIDPNFPDGYELRISTAGTAVADFMANAELFSVAAEETNPVGRYVDLAAAGYMNQPVHLAWRNITNDGFLLLVDNVTVVELP